MARLLVHVEGPTEETFVNEVLARHLYGRGYSDVSARIMGNSRLRANRGGICGWPVARRDIVNHLKEDRRCLATTMVDFYGMPSQGPGAWPERAAASLLPIDRRAAAVEQGLLNDVTAEIEGGELRFVPYVVMHEYEALLFSDCAAFAQGIGRQDLAPAFQGIRDQFESPEQINDSPTTAPSKRILRIVSNYEKPLLGTLAALSITLERIREQCAGFDAWIARLEERGDE